MIYAGSSGPSLLADPDREPFQYEIQQQALHHLMPGVQTTTEEKIQGTTQYHHLNKKAYNYVMQQLQRWVICAGLVRCCV